MRVLVAVAAGVLPTLCKQCEMSLRDGRDRALRIPALRFFSEDKYYAKDFLRPSGCVDAKAFSGHILSSWGSESWASWARSAGYPGLGFRLHARPLPRTSHITASLKRGGLCEEEPYGLR